ncbi:hypothetical protein LCM08_13050 [Salipiger pacificus]|nr:hypothetical protein [Alloyangia pacifica]
MTRHLDKITPLLITAQQASYSYAQLKSLQLELTWEGMLEIETLVFTTR